MQVAILGPLWVENAGQPVQIGGARLRALLIRLAADTGRWVSPGSLAAALWPDDDAPSDQANALQSLVSRLRRALPGADLIESGPAGYRLMIGDDDLDATRFEREIASARRELAAGRTADGAAGLRQALAIWRGTPLDDVSQAPYATAWASRLEELRLSATEDRIDADLELGQLEGLVAELDQLIVAHPLRERLRGQLIRALYRSGRQAEALAAYEQIRELLAEELGVDPSPQLKALHLSVLRAQDAPPAPAAQRQWRRTNLRPSLTSFVGREQDARRVHEAMQRSRLVTLVGAGGSGKTRLSMEVAWRLDDCGTDGIWQAELAPVSDPDGLAAAALGAIGTMPSARLDNMQPLTQRDDLSRLVESIGERDVVLLLDNCEHVIDAAAKLAEQLLGQCPRLKVLATSREPLGITGESLWPVQPLVFPRGADDLDAMQATAAVQLFADRGALVRPGFTVDAGNAAAVGEICRRLDGLPLAIELAAARLRTLSPQSIAARLQDRFRLLTGGSRTAMPRHQTLRAVVAWSWELLTDSERAVTERLSVFPGGATVAAAAAIAVPDPDSAGSIDDPLDDEVLDRLSALADKSLLVPMDGEQPRYRMLETIREFSAEQLAERGQVPQVRAVYMRYFLELAERAEPRLRGRDQLAAMQELNDERENLLTAIRFAVDAGDASVAVRFGAALSWYWTLLGRHDEATSLLTAALELPGESPPEPRLIALTVQTLSLAATNQQMPSQQTLDQLDTLAAQLDPLTSHPLIALIRPALCLIADDPQGVAEAMERLSGHQDPWAVAMLRLMDAVSSENAGDITRLRQTLPEALRGFREIGDRWGIGTALTIHANVLSMDGDSAGSVAAMEESRDLMAELRARDDESFAQVRIALLHLQAGHLDAARAEVAQALEIAMQSGSGPGEGYARLGMSLVAAADGDLVAARTWAEQALALEKRSATGPPQVLAMALAVVAHLDIQEGELDAARRRLAESWEAAMPSRDMPVMARVATVVADLASRRGEPELAGTLIGAGQSLRGGPDLGDPELRDISLRICELLGADAYAAAEAAGRAMTQPAAVSLIAGWLGVQVPENPVHPGPLR